MLTSTDANNNTIREGDEVIFRCKVARILLDGGLILLPVITDKNPAANYMLIVVGSQVEVVKPAIQPTPMMELPLTTNIGALREYDSAD